MGKHCGLEWPFWHGVYPEVTRLCLKVGKLRPFCIRDMQCKINIYLTALLALWVLFVWNQVKYKNNNHTSLFHCIKTKKVLWKMLKHSA